MKTAHFLTISKDDFIEICAKTASKRISGLKSLAKKEGKDFGATEMIICTLVCSTFSADLTKALFPEADGELGGGVTDGKD